MSLGHPMPQRKIRKKSEKKDPLHLCQDAIWLSSLTEPELDFLMSLKQLATMRSKEAGHQELANKFDVRMLHALGGIVLELFRKKLKSRPTCAMYADLIDKLPLLTTRIANANLDDKTPSFGTLKRKHIDDGLCDTAAESSKKQKITVKEEPVEY